jgi:hypothetical protein
MRIDKRKVSNFSSCSIEFGLTSQQKTISFYNNQQREENNKNIAYNLTESLTQDTNSFVL